MTSDEVWDLLELIASIDRRKVGLTDRQVWEGLVGDLPAADAQAAVIAYYRESREWIMPADVRSRVRALRQDRLSREIVPAPPPEVTDQPGRYKAELQAGIKRIADGFSVQEAIGSPPGVPSPPLAEVRKALGPGGAPAERHLPPEEIARRQVLESRTARGAAVTTEPDEEPAA
jgi:hypothetical protein